MLLPTKAQGFFLVVNDEQIEYQGIAQKEEYVPSELLLRPLQC
jgi:hypothetical protein